MTEGPDHGVQGGAGGVQAAPRDQTRLRVKAGLLAGRSIKGLSRDLGISRPTVQEHVARLLSSGQLVKSEGRFFPGPAGGVQGAKVTPHHAPVQGGVTPDPAPPARIDVATDGKRVFRITRAPAAIDQVPGFVASKPKGRKPVTQLMHKVAYVEGGRTWNLWLEQGLKTDSWSLWVGQVQPPPPFAEFQKPGESPDDAWDRKTIDVAVAWATKAGVGLEPMPRRSRPVSVTYPGLVIPTAKGVPYRSGPSDADQTPPDPSGRLALEVRGGDLQDFVNNGPEWKRAVMGALQDQRDVIAFAVKVQGIAAEAVAGLTKNHAGHLAHNVAQTDGVAARPSPSFAAHPSTWDFV